jgi:hypothetical protein
VADVVRFYFDEHLSSAVADGLRRRGIDVETAQEVGRDGLPDEEQLAYANRHGRIMVTFDSDYLVLASTGMPHSGIAFCHPDKYDDGGLIAELTMIHGAASAAEMVDFVYYL